MNKVIRENIKKSTFVISTIAILLMITISNTPTMNSSAFDLGLISKDTNIGSIDTDSLFNCVGAAITCDNDNTVNNNVVINNDTNDSNTPPTCIECLETTLTSDQLVNLLAQLRVETVEQACASFSGGSASALLEALVGIFGLDEQTAQTLVDCLVEAGVLVEP